MAWNTSAAKFKSTELALLDCGFNIKQARTAEDSLIGTFTTATTRVLGIGECVAMVRVPAGAVVLGAELYWGATTASVLGIGDPYACGRLLGAVQVGTARGIFSASGGCGIYTGHCGTLTKTGLRDSTGAFVGDGCGIGYTYTCETDIFLTNLYSDTNATMGGWAGSSAALGSATGSAISTGTFQLVVKIKPV